MLPDGWIEPGHGSPLVYTSIVTVKCDAVMGYRGAGRVNGATSAAALPALPRSRSTLKGALPKPKQVVHIPENGWRASEGQLLHLNRVLGFVLTLTGLS